MKKSIIQILFAALLVITLGACGNLENTAENQKSEKQTNQTAEQNKETVSIRIMKGKDLVTQKGVDIKKDDILMDVMKSTFSIKEDKGFITSIEGIHPKKGEENNYGWLYYVNGDMPNVGAADYKLKPGDKVIFEYKAFK
ncbi:DUF4430 domain-containing protein [Aciduricibacillus chroicocephali]|uniref:DUF4430 domain-containing protein n=1 Tax=Aciduricibacillus chroicocephali TaxID=3054939 RepID=A0ABY9KUN2_9BACI|nr:DUF4430 domain-containing protein [Bacillaceae bacterium 44XB]